MRSRRPVTHLSVVHFPITNLPVAASVLHEQEYRNLIHHLSSKSMSFRTPLLRKKDIELSFKGKEKRRAWSETHHK